MFLLLLFWYRVVVMMIVPLRTKRTSSDIYVDPPRLNQLMYDVPIENFRLQQYIENKVLVCKIETPNGAYDGFHSLIDRMWIKLYD